MAYRDKIQAFSLIELLLVLVISSLMIFIAMPYGQELFGKNRALAYANELKSALLVTRFSAIKLGEPVTFCGSKSLEACDGGSWQEGRIIITDSGNIIRVFSKIFSGDKMIWRGKKEITFLPTGRPRGSQGSFHYCPRGVSKNAIAVILNLVGRVRISDENSDDERISCNL